MNGIRRDFPELTPRTRQMTCRRLQQAASGVLELNAAWRPRGAYALHTLIGQNSRRRKGLEPWQRLSETTSRNLQARSTLSSRQQM